MTGVVQRGNFLVTVVSAGEIEAEKKKIIANEVSRDVVIKWLVDEGTRVQKGQDIIRFESQSLLDQIEDVRNEVASNESYYTEAKENLELKIQELDHELKKARDSLVDAESALKRYVEGEGPVMLKEYQSKVALAERDLMLAREKLEFKLKVNDDPTLNSPYSDSEIKADQLTVSRLELSVEQAESDLSMFKEYDRPRRVRQLESDLAQAKLNLNRATVMEKTQKLIAETNMNTRFQRLQQSKQKLKELLDQESKLVLTAEASGLVAYDTGQGWRAEQTTVAVGESIRPRQQLMIIPDMDSLQVRTKVFEAVISMVQEGQSATIRLDSRPEDTYSGTVRQVDVLPSSQHRWLNPGVKVFEVVVDFDDSVDLATLKPGLTTKVEIKLAELDDVLYVPIAAVFTEQEETFCRVLREGNVERVPVVIGKMNDEYVVIREGLTEGETVLLVSPMGEAQSKGTEKATDEGESDGAEPSSGGDNGGAGGGPR